MEANQIKMNSNNTQIKWRLVDELIKKSKRILLTTHENPDGDGLGSERGIYYHLKEIGKDARIINCSIHPDVYDFLNEDNIFEYYDPPFHDSWIKAVDLVMIFDVGDFARTRAIARLVKKYNLETINIDHHPHPKKNFFSHNIVDLSAAATGCMVYDYLKFSRKSSIDKKSLEGIYTAVMTDTGSFRHSNTDRKCHEIAIECLENNIDTHSIYKNIYENSNKSRMKLMGGVLSQLNYELQGLLAWFVITQEMITKANATNQDVDGFSDLVRSIKGVEIALMIHEKSEESCRINFRSKGNVIVNDIAKKLGGGGHAFAAGAMVPGTLGDVSEKVLEATISSIKKKINGKNI